MYQSLSSQQEGRASRLVSLSEFIHGKFLHDLVFPVYRFSFFGGDNHASHTSPLYLGNTSVCARVYVTANSLCVCFRVLAVQKQQKGRAEVSVITVLLPAHFHLLVSLI